jgi:ABC-type sugar transport system substrate-binding protein
MPKKRLAAVTVLVVAAASSATVPAVTATATPSSTQATVKIGFITKFPVDFYFTLVGGAKQWQKSHPGVSVIYAQGKSATDDAGEIAAIQDMVASGVKGIAITPTSPAVIPALNKAVKAGVKVVLMDNDLPTWKLKTSVVATNNLKGGTLAGKWLATKLRPGDTLGILQGVPGVPALDDRVNGMLAGLGAMKGKIKIVSKLETDCDQTKGAHAAQTMLTANPHLTAIYSACGPPALGAIQSIKNAGIKPGGIILVGFDGLAAEVKAIKGGQEDASVAQHPDKIGSLGIATLYSAVLGHAVPKNVDTGTSLITKGNAK